MELIKSNWVSDENSVHLQMPFSKVNKERRLVSGFATLDNDDRQGDVVTADASRQAFKNFAGNMREMHQPIAIGRLVNFKEDSFYDTKTDKFYNGIYVTAYISKGAQDTWEKVLDGTLTGFSIGGDIKDSSTEFVKEAGETGKNIRFIKAYQLVELSLVDNPANQLANVFSISKSQTGSVIKGMVADTEVVNVFWCVKDGLAKNSSSATAVCHMCDSTMENIGWFEKGENEADKVEETVNKFLRQGEDANATNTNGEGGVEKMTDEVKNETEETPEAPAETAATDEVATPEVTPEAAAPEGEATSEVANQEPDFEKMFDSLKASVNETLEKNQTAVQEAVSTVESKVAEVTKALDDKTSEFQKNLDELSEMLNGIKSEREGVEKRIDALESATAIKKSGDVVETEPEKKLQKGLWAGAILGE